jgi:predicted nucleotidyltransferase
MMAQSSQNNDTFDELKRLEPVLRERFPEVQVLYLFGSRATGEARSSSDVDVAIFVDSSATEADPLYDLRVADFLDQKLDPPVELVLMNKANPVLQHEVLRTGQRVYETDSELRARYELIAFKRFLDLRHYQRKRRAWRSNG